MSVRSDTASLEPTFSRGLIPLALLVFGTFSILTVPPGQTPDEAYSLLRAWHIVDGHLEPERIGDWGGGHFPPAVVNFVTTAAPLVGQPESKFSIQDLITLARATDSGSVTAAYPTAAPYTFIPFLPQAAGVAIARSLGFPPLAAFYAGRFGNLLFGTAAVAFALGLTPIGRRFLGLVCLLPMTVHLLGSFAPDVSVFAAALVFTAMVMRLAAAGPRSMRKWEYITLVGTTAWVAMSKPPYLPLAVVMMSIPVSRFGSRGKYCLAVAGVLGTGIIAAAVGISVTRPFYPATTGFIAGTASVAGQTRYILNHPGAFVGVMAGSIPVKILPMCRSLFELGWSDVWLGWTTTVTWWLLAGAASDHGECRGSRILSRWWAVLAVLGSLVGIFASMYVWWTPVGSAVVYGVQGRYLLPLLPAMMFVVPRLGVSRFVSGEISAMVAVVLLVAAAGSVLTRYYVSGASPSTVGTIVVLAGIVGTVAFSFPR